MKWGILLTLLSQLAFGEVGTSQASFSRPELAGESKVGRITLYKSHFGISWFAPIAFTPQLQCAPSNSDSSSCYLQVINALTIAERDQISTLMNSENLKITHFSNIDSNVVSEISESFQNLPANLNGREIKSETLQLSDGRTPYASTAFRVSKKRAVELQEEFAREGLGQFYVTFNLHAQRLENYLAFHDGVCLRDKLLDVRDKVLSRREVRTLTRKLITSCGLTVVGWDSDEAEASAVVYVRDRLFKTALRGLSVNTDAVQAVGDAFVIYNTVFPEELRCEATIELKDGAKPKYECAQWGR